MRRFTSFLRPRKISIAAVTVALVFAFAVVGSTVAAANGVNHDDPPPPANPNCTNSPGTSGTCSSPQPLSNADLNNTGANDTSNGNQYRSTRNGAPSDNVSNNGLQTGQPCAGCVGKADNKNPHGQALNGTDPNNGYECDGNNGIGQTNPAHTSCTTTESQGTTGSGNNGDTGTTGSGGGSNSTNGTTSGSAPGTAPETPAEVLGETETAAGAPVAMATGESSSTAPAEVLGETITSAPEEVAGALAATGSNPFGLSVVALALLGAGLGVLTLRRRRLSAAPR
jgi:hypothetical protein